MTLSRKGFFSGLMAMASAIIAKAQTNNSPQAVVITPCRPKIQWGQQIPLCNGQCPQPDCGYRAPELPKRDLKWDELEQYQTPGELYLDRRYPSQLVPSKRLNRCPNCNTAFWQDPEPPAKEG